MSKLLFIVSLVLALLSCKNKNGKPGDILPKQKMEEVLWDMIRAGEFLNGFVLYKDTATNKALISQQWYDKIYRTHRITKNDFEKSYAYYENHHALMRELLDSLSKKQVSVRQSVKDSTAKKDSLATAESLGEKIIPPSGLVKKATADSLRRSRLKGKKLIRKSKLQTQ
jgi:hypothetical protein